jgi:hypothetical protein
MGSSTNSVQNLSIAELRETTGGNTSPSAGSGGPQPGRFISHGYPTNGGPDDFRNHHEVDLPGVGPVFPPNNP